MTKLSSYQKLKAEKQQLIEDIYILTVLDKSDKPEDVLKVFTLRTRYNVKFNMENLFWVGKTKGLKGNNQ